MNIHLDVLKMTFAWFDAPTPPSHIGSPVQYCGEYADAAEWANHFRSNPEWKLGLLCEMPNWALVKILGDMVHPDTMQRMGSDCCSTLWRTETGLLGGSTWYYGTRYIRSFNDCRIKVSGIVQRGGRPLSYHAAREVLFEAICATLAHNRRVLLPS